MKRKKLIETPETHIVRSVKRPDEDFDNAKKIREIWKTYMNSLIDDKARLTRLHPYLMQFPPAEKQKKNLLLNRIRESSALSAMGLDYILEAEWTPIKLIIAIRRACDPDIYYKLPSDCGNVDDFIKSVLNKMYFLFVNPDPKNPADITRYALLPPVENLEHLRWRQSKVRRNRNRISLATKPGPLLNPDTNLSWADIEDTPRNKSGFETKQSLRNCLLDLLE